MNDYRTELATITTDTAAAQNTDILASDFQVKRAGNLVRITISATAVALRLVPSSGTTVPIDSALPNTVLTTFELALDAGRTFNLQTNDPSGITVYHLVIQEIQA